MFISSHVVGISIEAPFASSFAFPTAFAISLINDFASASSNTPDGPFSNGFFSSTFSGSSFLVSFFVNTTPLSLYTQPYTLNSGNSFITASAISFDVNVDLPFLYTSYTTIPKPFDVGSFALQADSPNAFTSVSLVKSYINLGNCSATLSLDSVFTVLFSLSSILVYPQSFSISLTLFIG